MKRLIEKTVFSGFVTACRLATWPTSRSPFLEKATTEGVVRLPSGLVRTRRAVALHDRHHRVRRAQVDADDLAQGHLLLH